MIPRLSGLGTALRFRRHPPEFFHTAHQAHGDLVELHLPGVTGWLVFHPRDVGTVLRVGERQHRALLRDLLGGGLFVTPSGSLWRERRTLLQPAFQPARLDGLARIMADAIDEVLAVRWAGAADTRDLAQEMRQLTLLVTLRATLGVGAIRYPDPVVDALDGVLDYLDHRLFGLWKAPRAFPTPANRAYTRQMALLRQRIGSVVAEGSGGDHFLAWFREEGQARDLPVDHLVEEALSIFVAGTETTGTLLVWCLVFLGRHPEIAARLRAALDEGIGRGPVSLAGIRAVPLLRAVVEEALRLYPPAWAVVRRLPNGAELGDGTLPPGALVWVSPYATHRDPRFWPEPERFDPDRFLDRSPGTEVRYAWFPFGGGPHHCIGHHFAVLEAELVLAHLLLRWDVQVTEQPGSRTRAWIALAPQPSPRLAVRRRSG